MRRSLLLVTAAAALIAGPPPAAAAIPFRSCADGDLLDAGAARRQCARIRVPLDHSGAVAGRVPLYLERVRASRRRRGAVVALAGGPGQAATPFTSDFASVLAPALRSRDLLVLDQRGTGGSGVLRCPSLERQNLIDPAGTAATRCGQRIGSRRPFFTTDDSVEDIELVRRRLGLRRIVLYGVSYGTKVALAYALAHPERVERLVVDSAFEPEGPDPFYRDTLAAMPRSLRQLCARRCSGDAARDLEALAGRLGSGPMRGYIVGADGRRRRASVGQFDLFALLLAGDMDPSLRTGTPAAMRSALRGDPLPLIRLARRARIVEGEPPPPRELSVGLYATTTCEEAPLPWSRSAPPEERRRQAQAAVRALPQEQLRPFGPELALASDVIGLCLRWPTGPAPPPLAAGPFPRAPALVLAADQDLRTPREGAAKVVARLPHARLVTVRDASHGVLFSDFTGCSARAVRDFFANRRVRTRCSRRAGVFVADPHVPAALADLSPARGASGPRGRTLRAVSLTLADVLGRVGDAPRGGGLRGGRYSSRVGGLERLGRDDLAGVDSDEEAQALLDELAESAYLDVRLERVELIRGVRVSGRLRLGLDHPRGLVRVSGGAAVPGRLRVGGSGTRIALAGRLGGRRVRALGDPGLIDAEAWAARRAAARPRPVSP